LELREADLLDAESMEKAITGAKFVVHIASPFFTDNKTVEELTKPAVDGTLSALKAAVKHGVQRVVVTSSVAAVSAGIDPVPNPITED